MWSKHFCLIWNSICALQASTHLALYLFLKISNFPKVTLNFCFTSSLYHLKWVSANTLINIFHLLRAVSETKASGVSTSTFLFLLPSSGETLCLRSWWGHKRAFKAVTLAPGFAPWLCPLCVGEKTRDSHKPGNHGEVVEQLGVVLRPGLLPGDGGGGEGEGGAAPSIPPTRHQHQLHFEQPHEVARSRPWDLARGACNQLKVLKIKIK